MSDAPCFRVSLVVRVTDSRSLFDAAMRRATEPGSLLDRDEARSKLTGDDGSIDVSACLATMLDPDAPPAGTDILEGTIERI